MIAPEAVPAEVRDLLEQRARERGFTAADLEVAGFVLRQAAGHGWVAARDYWRADGARAERRFVLRYSRAEKNWRWEGPAKGSYLPLGDPQNAGRVIVTEGESDALAAWRECPKDGSVAVVGLPGAGMPEEGLAALIGRSARVVIATDADAEGDRCAETCRRLLVEAGHPAEFVRRVRPAVPGKREPDLRDLLEHAADAGEDACAVLERAIGDAPQAVEPAGEAGALRFYSADELLDTTPERPEFVWDDYLAAGAITLLAGPPKRAGGKSTLAFALVRAILEHRETFLGRFLAGGPVVYLSEEPADLLRPKVRALRGLVLRLVWRETTPRPKPRWAESIRAAAEEAHRTRARLIVVDTFAAWAGLKAESEKDAGAVEEAIESLKAAAASGLAILLIHHHRKGGGEDGEAVRGSSALLAAVDIQLDLTRLPGEDAPPRQRILAAQSRWPGTPDALVIELAEDGERYRLVDAGDRDDVRRRAADAPALEALAGDGEAALTAQEVADAAGQSRPAAQKALARLLRAGQVVRSGRGVSGDPHRYRLAESLFTRPGTDPEQTGTDMPAGGRGGLFPPTPDRGGGNRHAPGGENCSPPRRNRPDRR